MVGAVASSRKRSSGRPADRVASSRKRSSGRPIRARGFRGLPASL